MTLPAELDDQQRHQLARRFAVDVAQRYGVAVDLTIHAPAPKSDHRNQGAHCLTTTREISRDATGGLVLGEKTILEFSDRKRRTRGLGRRPGRARAVAGPCHEALAQAGQPERIDARSLKEQGIDREATSHLGAAAAQIERRCIVSDRGDANRQVEADSRKRKQLRLQLAKLQAQQPVTVRVAPCKMLPHFTCAF